MSSRLSFIHISWSLLLTSLTVLFSAITYKKFGGHLFFCSNFNFNLIKNIFREVGIQLVKSYGSLNMTNQALIFVCLLGLTVKATVSKGIYNLKNNHISFHRFLWNHKRQYIDTHTFYWKSSFRLSTKNLF